MASALLALAIGVGVLALGAILPNASPIAAQDPDGQAGAVLAPPTVFAPTLDPLSITAGGIELSWTAPTTDLTITGYSIRRSPSNGSGSFEVIVENDPDTTHLDRLAQATLAQLDSASYWSYQVMTIAETTANEMVNSDWSETESVQLPVFPNPSSLTNSEYYDASADGWRVVLGWNAPTLSWSDEEMPSLSGYVVWRHTVQPSNPSGTVPTIQAANTTTSRSYSEIPPLSIQNAIRTQTTVVYTVVATYGVFYSSGVILEWPDFPG